MRVRRRRRAAVAALVVEADRIARRAQTPVGQLDLERRRHHEVLGLDVQVEHARAVHVVERAQQLRQKRRGAARDLVALGGVHIAPPVRHVGLQVALAFDKLVDDIVLLEPAV